MRTKPVVIIVSGPPCTGKTTLAKRIAEELSLPLISKDGIKETLFDHLGIHDRAWSQKLGKVSIKLLYYILENELKAQRSCIVESNFDAHFATGDFLVLKEMYDFEPVQILCECDGPTLFERFRQRAMSCERHPGHGDYLYYEEFRSVLLQGRIEPVEIGGALLTLDTTDFTTIDYRTLFNTIQLILHTGAYHMSQPSPLVQNVSDTALWVAYYRAVESKRPDALFHDPYAERLANERGKQIASQLLKHGSTTWAVVIRTRVLDEMILQTIEKYQPDTVINLAAGLDTRPYRLPLPSTLRWIEVDLPGIIAYKEEKLAGEKPVCQLERVSVDLTDANTRDALFTRINSESKQVFVLTEGLLIYLTEEQVSSLADALSAQPHFQWWLVEFLTPRILQYMQKSWNKHMDVRNIALHFAPEDNEAYFGEHGWSVAEYRSTMEEAHRLKRDMRGSWLMRFFMRFSSPAQREQFLKMTGYALLKRMS